MNDPGDPRSLVSLTAATVRASPGVFWAAVGLLLAAELSRLADSVPGETAITRLTLLSVTLETAAMTLAMLLAAWTVCSAGRAPGFAGLAAIPPERLRKFVIYGVIFSLWLLVITALLTKVVSAFTSAESGFVTALVGALAVAAALVIMYVQLGLVFPDTLVTGESSVMAAMVLGISSGRRLIAALAIPALLVTVPHRLFAFLYYDDATRQPLTDSVPALVADEVLVLVALPTLETFGWVMYGVALTRFYLALMSGPSAGRTTWHGH